MMVDENVEVFMCVDCAMLIANGDNTGMDDDTLGRALDGMNRWSEHAYVLCMGDSEHDHAFSKAPCDVCGTSLYGHRLHGWAVPK